MENQNIPIPNEPVVAGRSSVEVKKNAKGIYTWSVKIYDDDADKALDKMIELESKCQEKFGDKSKLNNQEVK